VWEGRERWCAESTETKTDLLFSPRLASTQNRTKPTSPTFRYRAHHLHRPSDNMGLRDGVRDFLSLPRKDRRVRTTSSSEASPIADPRAAGLAVPRPTESSPDLRIAPPTSPIPGPSTSRDQESNGTPTPLFRVIGLTTSPRNTDRYPVLDQTRPVFQSRQSKRPETSDDKTTDPCPAPKDKSNWKATTYATTKLAINLAKESADAFPPLKSVVGGLSAILKHCDVRPAFLIPHRPRCLRLS
jgi:hypothetical protein